MGFPQLAQGPIPGQQVLVLAAPGVGLAVEGVLKALHARLVSVVHRGGAGEAEQQQGGGFEQLLSPGPLPGGQAELSPPLLGLVPVLATRAQKGEQAGVSWVSREFMAE